MSRRYASRFIFCALTLGALGCSDKSSERACALFSVEECVSRPYCAVVAAQHLDEERQCQHPSQALACSALVDLDCGSALTLARDGDGQLFLLNNTCVPSGLSEEKDTTLYTESTSWPGCE